jgi:hypothetical protein
VALRVTVTEDEVAGVLVCGSVVVGVGVGEERKEDVTDTLEVAVVVTVAATGEAIGVKRLEVGRLVWLCESTEKMTATRAMSLNFVTISATSLSEELIGSLVGVNGTDSK